MGAKEMLGVDSSGRGIPYGVSELRQVAAVHTMDLYHRDLMVWAARTIDALLAALKAQTRGSCFCEKGIGNPMMTEHSAACQQAFDAIARAAGRPVTPEP